MHDVPDNAGSSTSGSESHNALLPIHRLPVELLMTILYGARCCLADIRLSHVCRHWREIVRAMPEFWVSTLKHYTSQVRQKDVDNRWMALLEHCLVLSAPLPIKLNLDILEQEHLGLTPHASRITELSVDFRTHAGGEAFATALRCGLPNLIRLRYNLDKVHLATESFQAGAFSFLDASRLPGLRHLEVSGRCGPWSALDSQVTHSLESLIVHDRPLRIADFADFVNGRPSLTALALRDFSRVFLAAWTPRNRPFKSEMWRLPNLRRLHISFRGEEALLFLLVHLEVPAEVHVELFSNQSSVGILRALDAPSVLGQHVVPSLTRYYLGMTQRTGRVRLRGYTPDGVERLDVALWRDSLDAMKYLTWLCERSAPGEVAVNCPVRMEEQKRFHYDIPRKTLNKVELLGATPFATRRGFVRWMLDSSPDLTDDLHGPVVAEMTLSWVLNLDRGNEKNRNELEELASLLGESASRGNRLGRLELYGAVQNRHIVTGVGQVWTNRARCVDMVESILVRLEEVAGEVVVS